MIHDVNANIDYLLYSEVLTAEDITLALSILLKTDLITLSFTAINGVQGNISLGLTKTIFEAEMTKHIGERININITRQKPKLLPVS